MKSRGRHSDTRPRGNRDFRACDLHPAGTALLGITKRFGQRLHSRATAREGTQNLICAAQAAIVLVGLIVIGIWPGGWPADPVVALGIAAWSAWEGG